VLERASSDGPKLQDQRNRKKWSWKHEICQPSEVNIKIIIFLDLHDGWMSASKEAFGCVSKCLEPFRVSTSTEKPNQYIEKVFTNVRKIIRCTGKTAVT
jgi:hypothetical protein